MGDDFAATLLVAVELHLDDHDVARMRKHKDVDSPGVYLHFASNRDIFVIIAFGKELRVLKNMLLELVFVRVGFGFEVIAFGVDDHGYIIA